MKHLAIAALLATALGGQTAQAADVVKLADVVELSGGGASNGNNWKNGVELAAAEINAAGGILGRKIELTNYDTQTNPGVSRAQVQKAIDDGAFAILGPIYSGSVKVNQIIAQRAGVPQIVAAQASDITKLGNDFLFRTNLDQGAGMAKLARYMKEEVKVKTVGIVWLNNDYGKGGRDDFLAAIKPLGIQVAADLSAEPGQFDFASDVIKLKSTKPDAVVVHMTVEENARFLKEAYKQNLGIPLFGETALLGQAVLDLAGPAANGVRGHVSLTADAPVEAIRELKEKFTKKYGYVPDHTGIAGYTAPYIVKAVVTKIGKFDQEAFAKALHGMTITPEMEPGILMATTWDKNGDSDRDSFLVEVVDGKQKIVKILPKLHP